MRVTGNVEIKFDVITVKRMTRNDPTQEHKDTVTLTVGGGDEVTLREGDSLQLTDLTVPLEVVGKWPWSKK